MLIFYLFNHSTAIAVRALFLLQTESWVISYKVSLILLSEMISTINIQKRNDNLINVLWVSEPQPCKQPLDVEVIVSGLAYVLFLIDKEWRDFDSLTRSISDLANYIDITNQHYAAFIGVNDWKFLSV